MDGQLRVELADLRGWADQVGRAGGHCGHLADYLTTFVPDGDFGRILWVFSDDYERFARLLRDTLALDASRLDDTRVALRHAVRRYARTDSRVAHGFGLGTGISDDDRVAPAFRDRGGTTPLDPVCSATALPEVTFGWGFDQAAELLQRCGGWDLRHLVTDWLAGDVAKALDQASAWEHAGGALRAVHGNLTRGAHVVATTWEGRAATSSTAYVDAWIRVLTFQSAAMEQVAAHLRDAVTVAVDVAQVVVDLVKEIVLIVMAGWTFASIPIYGQVKAIEGIKDVLRLVWDAKRVLAVFWQFLVFVKNSIIALIDGFSAESLPAGPTLPAVA